MVHHTICPLCKSSDIVRDLSCIDYYVSAKEFSVFKCSNCNFHFTQDYPEESDIAQYYESESYISHSDTSKGLTNKLYRIGRSFMLRKKKNLILDISGMKTGSLLDIGSGTGYFAATMKKAGWYVEGIELNEKARNFSRSHFGLRIEKPDVLSTFKNDSFDCITLWHVLEHFHDPVNYAAEVYRLLRPGAFSVVALPNCNSYDAEYYNRFWAAWDVPRHLWHFNPATLKIFAETSGFNLERIQVLPLDVFYISSLSEKYKLSSFPILKGISRAVKFSILAAFNKNRSSSLIYILRKPGHRDLF